MKKEKYLFVLFIALAITVINFSCNKGVFKTTPLDPLNPDLYVPKDTVASVPNFRIYSAIRYNNTPGVVTYTESIPKITFAGDITEYGMHPFIIAAPSWLLTGGDDNPNSQDIIDPIKFQSAAIATAQYPDIYVQLDEEGWDGVPTTSRRDSLLKSIETFRKYNTTNKIGFYAQLPENKYLYTAINTTSAYTAWQNTNTVLKPVYDKVDVFFPSCYTRNQMTDSASWRKYTLACVDEIRRFSNKPIIVGLTLQYGNSVAPAKIKDHFIEPEYIEYQLETLLADGRVQGVFYWTSNTVDTLGAIPGYYYPPSNLLTIRVVDNKTTIRVAFDKDMPWLKTITQFIKKHNIQ